jgi:hypothetical protein
MVMCVCLVLEVFEWFKRFKEGRGKIGDNQRLGRLSTSKTDANIEKVGEIVSTKSLPEHSSSC